MNALYQTLILKIFKWIFVVLHYNVESMSLCLAIIIQLKEAPEKEVSQRNVIM